MVGGAASPRIFLSYRREDASGHAGRLYDALVERFGAENVFMDIDTIDVGADFAEAVARAVASCDALIALVGRRWLTETDASGRRRLDDPNDFVRLELEAALERDVAVVPACVQGAQHPSAEQLPDSLAPIARRQGTELRDIGWHDDVKRLIERLERVVAPPAPPERRRRWRPRPALLAGVAVLVGAAAVAAVLLVGRSPDGAGTNAAGAFPNADERRLLALVPLITRADCNRIDWGDPAARASVECGRPPGIAARYQLFPSTSVRDQWYVSKRQEANIAPGSGSCTAQRFQGEQEYVVDRELAGRLACYYGDEREPYLVWTDGRSSVGAEANNWKERGEAAAENLLIQWRCCLRPQP